MRVDANRMDELVWEARKRAKEEEKSRGREREREREKERKREREMSDFEKTDREEERKRESDRVTSWSLTEHWFRSWIERESEAERAAERARARKREREGEGERQRANEREMRTPRTHYYILTKCEEREREREREREGESEREREREWIEQNVNSWLSRLPTLGVCDTERSNWIKSREERERVTNIRTRESFWRAETRAGKREAVTVFSHPLCLSLFSSLSSSIHFACSFHLSPFDVILLSPLVCFSVCDWFVLKHSKEHWYHMF